ncbi:BTB/POZ domain-containing protein [Platanthera zijinensis]|uniref:BTB/POZ domain-containing protein n=1 Tax=Platanthera zijinensis TaxID=2320716 RepID=A0AAP0G6V2_9ASPA
MMETDPYVSIPAGGGYPLSDRTIRVHRCFGGIELDANQPSSIQDRRADTSLIVIQMGSTRSYCWYIPSFSNSSNLSVSQGSIADMLVALEGILQSENQRILSLAIDVVMKLVSCLGSSIRQYHMIEVVFALSRLLSLSHSGFTISSVIALNHILMNLGCTRSEAYVEVWRALGNPNTVGCISLAIQNYAVGISSSSEYFTQMTSLLKLVLWKWPPCRYYVWSNSTLIVRIMCVCLSALNFLFIETSYIVSALCGNGALKLLENEELFSKIVWALESSRAYSVRLEALKLCQQVLRSQEGCSKLTNFYCESIVQGMVAALSGWRSSGSRKVPPDQISLVKEACHCALITRWAGLHHSYFWKLEVDSILLDVLVGHTSTIFEKQIIFQPVDIIAEISNTSIEIRPYIWSILGWLAAHCAEDFLPIKGKSECLDVLIKVSCSVASQLWNKGKTNMLSNFCEVESVSRAVLLMVFSPCKYISLQARTCMSEVARSSGVEYLEKLLDSLTLFFGGDVSPVSYSPHTLIGLMSLACYSTLPLYQEFIVLKRGTDLLVSIINRCLKSEMHVNRSIVASHLHGVSDGKLCCWSSIENWEGGDLILFYSLQILSQLMPFSNFICDYPKIDSRDLVTSNTSGGLGGSLFESLSSILENNISPGIRMYAQHVFGFFGLYGFPNKLGKRMELALAENELADLQFLLSDGMCLRAHGAILLAGCPYLLPAEDSCMKKNMSDGGYLKEKSHRGTVSRHEVKLSDRVDSFAFAKILEYNYTGFTVIEDKDVKPVRILAKRCGLNFFSYMLNRKLPEWGSSVLNCNFSAILYLGSFMDVILEVNRITGETWTCPICVLTSPHIHAHKIILWSNCGFLRALFQSGMSESYSEIIKVPIGFEALTKLVMWFYTGELPRINLDCYWNNISTNEQVHELEAYLELSSLAKFWLLDEVEEDSSNVVLSCLESNHNLSMEIINLALGLHQPRIVEAAVANIAPLYPKMRDSGDLENLTEEAADLLRSEYVRLSQNGFLNH